MRTITPKNAKVIPLNAERVFKGIIFDVYQWQQPLFDGSSTTFEMLKRPDTVVVIGIKDNKLVLLREEQPGHAPYFGFPGGRHDIETETELHAAQREMAEETGLTFKTWKLLTVVQPVIKLDWLIYYFLADDFTGAVPTKLDAGEKVEVQLMDFAAVKKLAEQDDVRITSQDVLQKIENLEQLRAWPAFRES